MVGADACIYGIPYNAERVIKFNPVDQSLTEIGPYLKGMWKYGVLAGNNCIYCLPTHGPNILKINTMNGNVVTVFTTGAVRRYGFSPWDTVGALSPTDGCIYFFPSYNTRMMKIDPRDDTVCLINIMDLVNVEGDVKIACSGIVVGNDNCLYGIPLDSNRILKFNPVDQRITLVGKQVKRHFNCYNGVLGRDGNIYASRYDGRILKIDVANNDWSWASPSLSRSTHRLGWRDAMLGDDGCIYWPPYLAGRTLKYDPEAGIRTLIGQDFGNSYNKWKNGARSRTSNGVLYCLPERGIQGILAIDTNRDGGSSILYPPTIISRLFAKNETSKTYYEHMIALIEPKEVYRMIQECIPPTVKLPSGLRFPSFAFAASFENTSVSVIYHLLRRNLDSSPLSDYGANDFLVPDHKVALLKTNAELKLTRKRKERS